MRGLALREAYVLFERLSAPPDTVRLDTRCFFQTDEEYDDYFNVYPVREPFADGFRITTGYGDGYSGSWVVGRNAHHRGEVVPFVEEFPPPERLRTEFFLLYAGVQEQSDKLQACMEASPDGACADGEFLDEHRRWLRRLAEWASHSTGFMLESNE